MYPVEKYKQKYRIPSARLHGWDYGSPGLYFVTICTKNRESYFGDIVETQNFASPVATGPSDGERQNFASLVATGPFDGERQNFASPVSTGPFDGERQNFASPVATGQNPPLNSDSQNPETQNLPFNADASNTETQNLLFSDNGQTRPNTETQNLASLRYTIIGNVANQYWLEIPTHFPFVELDEYVVMPNHVHGILFLNKPDYEGWQSNKFGPQSKNLGSVIRGYKAGVKTYATTNQIEFGWQPRFHDHIIRSEKELNNIRQYIISNPEKWHLDKNNPENLSM